MRDLPPDPPRRPGASPSSSESGPDAAGHVVDGLPIRVLQRYAAGTSDPAERRLVEAWTLGSPSRAAYLGALTRTWARGNWGASEGEREETSAAWRALRDKLDIEARPASAPPIPPAEREERGRASLGGWRRPDARRLFRSRQSRRRRSILTAAAAVVVISVASGGTILSRQHAARPEAVARALPPREVSTDRGQRARVQLGDGSTVVLGVLSRLRFPADFGTRTRELELEGEAYFEVVHDSLHPFVVRAGGSRIVDLGTAFVLRSYPSDARVRVVVAEGNVSLGADVPGAPAATVLTRGQAGRLARGELVPRIEAVDPAAYTDWISGRLTFDNAPLSEVIADLGRWHSVQIKLADSSLAHETLTASFVAASPEEAVQTLTTVLHLRARREGKAVVLSRRGD